MGEAFDFNRNGIGDLVAHLGRDSSRDDQVVTIEGVNISVLVKLRTPLPIAVGEKGAEIVDRGFVEEEKVRMACGAARGAFGVRFACSLPSIDEAGEVADIGAGKISDQTDVDCD